MWTEVYNLLLIRNINFLLFHQKSPMFLSSLKAYSDHLNTFSSISAHRKVNINVIEYLNVTYHLLLDSVAMNSA